MTRVDKSKRNIRYGLMFQFLYLIGTFVVRVIMLKTAGIEALSINGLLIEVVNVLAIAELGVGMAISYSLYKPLADGDENQISAIMVLFRRIYRYIGIGIFGLGVIFLPFSTILLKDIDVSRYYFYAAYMLVLLRASVPYLYSYNLSLINADQQNYIMAQINIVLRFVFFLVEIALLLVTHELLVYLVVEMIYNITYYGITAIVANKKYPYLKQRAQLDETTKTKIFTDIRRMFVGRMASRLSNSTDNILISTIVSTLMVGIYSQYSMIVNGLLRIFSQVNEAITGSIGNMLATENKEHCKQMFKNVTYFFFVGAMVCSNCFAVGIGPFLRGIIGKQYTFDFLILLIIVMNLFSNVIKMPLWTFFTANGMFQADQRISLTGAVINLVLSIILGLKYGVFGIFLGTQASILVMLLYKATHLFKDVFGADAAESIGLYVFYYLLFAFTFAVSWWFSTLTQGYGDIAQFFINCGFAFCISVIIGVLPFLNTKEFQYFIAVITRKAEH